MQYTLKWCTTSVFVVSFTHTILIYRVSSGTMLGKGVACAAGHTYMP